MSYIQDIHKLLGVYSVSYDALDEEFTKESIPLPDTIHINVDSIFKELHKHYEERFGDSKQDLSTSIISAIINMVGHYKHYYLKKRQNVTIYLYFYNEYNGDSNVDDIFHRSVNTIILLCKYLPNIYAVKAVSDKIAVTMRYFLKGINLIITRSMIDMLLIRKDVYGLRIMNKNNITSYHKDNFYMQFLKTDDEKYNEIPIEFSSIVISYTGHGKYKRTPKIGPQTIAKAICSGLADCSIIKKRYSDITLFISDIGKHLNVSDHSLAIKNFYELDIDYNYHSYIESRPAQKLRLDNYIITKFAKNELNKITTKYFVDDDRIIFDYLFEEVYVKGGVVW